MTPFTFRCADGELVTVEATNETQARATAMHERWGPWQNSPAIVHGPWQGRGLDLVKGRPAP